MFKQAGIPSINFASELDEVRHLICSALGLSDKGRYVDQIVVAPSDAARVRELLERRVQDRVPTGYLTNEQVFGENRFFVDENVIIPRPTLYPFLYPVLERVEWSNERALDLCAGSGCIGITLALKRPWLKVDLADISHAALQVAQININRFGLNDRLRCVESDLFSALDGPYSLIVSVPPYLASCKYDLYAADEVRKEPRVAFVGGSDGLDLVTSIIEQAPRFLAPGGTLMMEVGEAGAFLIPKRFPDQPFEWHIDSRGRNRGIFTLRNPGAPSTKCRTREMIAVDLRR